MTKIAISGCCGRMGILIAQSALAFPDITITAAVEKKGHPNIGDDVSMFFGVAAKGVCITDDIDAAFAVSDCLIDFTAPQATMEHVAAAVKAQKSIVIGTTGLIPEQRAQIEEASTKIPVLFSPNMSLGVNLLFDLTREVARRLDPSYNIEIIEAHHRAKKDSPSGTALRFAECAAEGRGLALDNAAVYGRHGMVGPRKEDEIAVHAVRGGDIVGEHTVLFAGDGERIELTHKAHSRQTFARGAVRAAQFVVQQKPGMYSMKDVLGL